MNSIHNCTVVEIATVLAGPAVGMFFAELGAKVIKIENPGTGGDVTRSWKLPEEDPDTNISAYFCSVNANKIHKFIDLTSEKGKKEIFSLLKEADILITNFKYGDDAKFGLNLDVLSELFPQLIIGQIDGFTFEKNRTAYDVVLQAECGFMSMNGTAKSGPIKMPVALIDILAAHQLKQGLLLAWIERQNSGKGSKVTVSLEDAALASLANQGTNYLMVGHIPSRLGNLHPNIAPYGETFKCKDGGEIVLAVGSDKQFYRLCTILDVNLVNVYREFETNLLRVKKRKALYKMLEPYFKLMTRDEILSECIFNNIPAGAVRSMDEVIAKPSAERMTWTTKEEDIVTKRLKSIAFSIEHFE